MPEMSRNSICGPDDSWDDLCAPGVCQGNVPNNCCMGETLKLDIAKSQKDFPTENQDAVLHSGRPSFTMTTGTLPKTGLGHLRHYPRRVSSVLAGRLRPSWKCS